MCTPPVGGLGGTSDHLEQGAFPRAVDADDPHRLAGIHCEVNVLQHPVQVVATLMEWTDPLGQPSPAAGILLVGLA